MSIESKELKGELFLDHLEGSIVFDQVCFDYPHSDSQTDDDDEDQDQDQEKDLKKVKKLKLPTIPVLRSVSFSIRAGECIGIVG